MKKSLLLSILALCVMVLPGNVLAQDQITFTSQALGGCCWDFSVRNGSTQSINKVEFTITTVGQGTFEFGLGPTGWGDPNISSADKVITYEGLPIAPNGTLAGYVMCMSSTALDQPVQITWKTYNNATVLTTKSVILTCTAFQGFERLDSASATTAKVGTDPIYNFTFFNRHTPYAADIKSVSFEMITPTAGMIRPSTIVAPAGWKLDSISGYRVHFTADGLGVEKDQSQAGFVVGLRSNSTVKQTNWVWRARDASGTLIDRDTLRNLANNADNGAADCDRVTATNASSCLYDITVSNFHAQNLQPPSSLSQVRVISKTSGVTFQSAPNKPAGWVAFVRPDTIYFVASRDSVALPSGITSSAFAASINNPSGGAFQVEWQTLRANTVLCSGTLDLQCSVAAPTSDRATLSEGSEECNYLLNVENSHNNPPSSLVGVSLEIPANSGTITAGVSDSNWEATSATATAVLYRVPSGGTNVMPPNSFQNFRFSVTPANPGQDIPVTWKTYDLASGTTPVSTGSVTVNCAAVVNLCEVVTSEVADQATCTQRINIESRREGTTNVNSVTITPLNGWTIENAVNIPGWQRIADASGSTVTYTGAIAPLTIQSFTIDFIGKNTANTFDVEVITTNTDNTGECRDTLTFTCEPTTVDKVDRNLASTLKLSINPNPSKGVGTISYEVPSNDNVVIALLDVLGNTQQTVYSGTVASGKNEVRLDAATLPNGTYYVRLETSVGTATRRIVINR